MPPTRAVLFTTDRATHRSFEESPNRTHHPNYEMAFFKWNAGNMNLMSIWKLLGLQVTGSEHRGSGAASAETETVRKIVEALGALDPNQARYIAALAFLLGRVANADQHISAEETLQMEGIVMQQGGLPEAQAVLVVHMAKTQNQLFGGTENFLVTREFAKIADREQKMGVLRCLYSVSAADKSISTVEDNQIRQISRELGLSHDEFIAVRLEYRDSLAVLKNLPKSQKP